MRPRIAENISGNYKKPCACGCGQLTWHLDVNKQIHNYLRGHNNVVKKKERKQIPCECGCGTLIWNWDKYCNGPNRFVKGHANIGKSNPHWKGGKQVSKHGYIVVNIGIRKRKFEHRIIWERYYKAALLPWADVHHINTVKTDNRIENLQAMIHGQHSSLSNKKH